MAQIDSDVILGGRYRLVRRIASGGMGSVWEAEDTILHRRVAVKILSEALSEDQRFVERFRREARATAGLSHPNVAGVFDYGEDGDRPFIVMELIDGETLADRLTREGRLPWREAVAIIEPVAAALEEAHRVGIVHRDVKPGNIMITRNGHVKVMDFGIAATTWATPLTATGAAMGTATYISPEQASGKPAGPQSDVYSLSVVLFEMLTGRPPFTGDTPVSVAMAHVTDAPPPVRQLAPDVPENVAAACQQALAKDPKARPASAAALASLLAAPDLVTVPLPRAVEDAAMRPSSVDHGTDVLPVAEARAPLPTRLTRSSRARGRRRLNGAVIVALLLALVLLGSILASSLAGGGGNPSRNASSPPASIGSSVNVPDVRGLLLPEAIAQLRSAGLTPKVVSQTGPAGATEGQVFNVMPAPGTPVPPGSSITLYVAAPCGAVGGGKGNHEKHCKGGDGGGGGD